MQASQQFWTSYRLGYAQNAERSVRVCNLGVQVASMAGNVYRFADMDAVVCHLIREGNV